MTSQLETKAFLTIDEVAQLLSVSRDTVNAWLADHSLKAFRKDRTVRISRKMLQEFLDNHPW